MSAQNLIDCSGDYGNSGCGGGNAVLSYQYVIDRDGLEPEVNYTYVGRAKECPYKKDFDEFEEDQLLDDDDVPCSFVYIGEGDEASLKHAVATIGPLSAAIDGSHDTFRFYSEGLCKK